ncbi:response regulator [Pseudoxanthomonas sp.]|jgi:two-component system capsular synthesis response regulator RcsB|uniref:response regulator n=1 Tax=Pseudoxanthomonas sp. TaxID=1871049 RepID=UPI003F822E00
MTLKIVLADDHPIIVSAVRQLLERAGHEIVAVASSSNALIEALSQHACDLVITDFSMPNEDEADGLSLLGLIQRRWPDMPVIVLTMVTNPAILQSILDAGVRGLINKTDAMTELAVAVQTIMRGQLYISRATDRLLIQAGNGKSAQAVPLSPRETEVIRLFASGKSVTEIARQLNRSVKTISTQKQEAMAKLGLKNDFDIYAYAREKGMLS